ncbi:unnamed protein product [Adineta steineri]|uniref:Uncharacterized protein n=1 Tax=Adineta steineri TaxID=433720 RepID=A0A814EVY7_9BILA|nr:unnamed protein product [Adineta steineri]CAF0976697.1 unnamed protein product [Adineta steineri]CAF3512260.1 unnamed protein product [Adineta steineri]CAF3911703.1 unnamed protein product [Adineta steineri]
MSTTPGRKRVQPILIEDDEDTESTNTDIFISSSSSNLNIDDLTPFNSAPISEPSSSSSLTLDIKQPSIKKNLYVPLNFDELSHIRNAQTNSEFATLLYDFKLYKNVVNGHICFSCRKVQFSLLQPGIRCTICLQRVCYKCQRKMTYRQDNICFVSLNLLRRSSITSIPNDMTIQKSERIDLDSSTTTSSKCKKLNKKKLSHNSFLCCIDCFILFDPASLV